MHCHVQLLPHVFNVPILIAATRARPRIKLQHFDKVHRGSNWPHIIEWCEWCKSHLLLATLATSQSWYSISCRKTPWNSIAISSSINLPKIKKEKSPKCQVETDFQVDMLWHVLNAFSTHSRHSHPLEVVPKCTPSPTCLAAWSAPPGIRWSRWGPPIRTSLGHLNTSSKPMISGFWDLQKI